MLPIIGIALLLPIFVPIIVLGAQYVYKNAEKVGSLWKSNCTTT